MSQRRVTGAGEVHLSRASKQYKRAYKACMACRNSKSKCETTSDGLSCVRCAREQKQCVYPAARYLKKRKSARESSEGCKARRLYGSDSALESLLMGQQESVLEAEQSAALHRRGPRAGSSDLINDQQNHADHTGGTDLGRNLTNKPILRSSITSFPSTASHGVGGLEAGGPQSVGASSTPAHGHGQVPQTQRSTINADLNNDVMRTIVSTSADAMGLLFKAAEQDVQETGQEQQESSMPMLVDQSPLSALTCDTSSPTVHLSVPSREVLDLWNQHRFVRQGWFDAREAVTYIDL